MGQSHLHLKVGPCCLLDVRSAMHSNLEAGNHPKNRVNVALGGNGPASDLVID